MEAALLASWDTVLLVILVAMTVRSMIGTWGHSGMGKPPMYGDFEAQRHWLEITASTPVGEWYRDTPTNDLQYWGLDYPPLTAYVSYFFGKIAQVVHPALVELTQSRGHESLEGKVFMRLSVLFCDICVLIPAILHALSSFTKGRNEQQKQPLKASAVGRSFVAGLLVVTLSPGLMLIDHGHFQYNGVCIGLALFAGTCVVNDRDILGSIFFCLSLNFKQMSLYYAPVFFFALLRKCLVKQGTAVTKIVHLVKIGCTVIATFALLWFPFCVYRTDPSHANTCGSALLQVLHRQFPFSRGIFEDKVANLWYSTSVVLDWRVIFSTQQLVYASLGLTLLLLVPICVNLMIQPLTPSRMLWSLTNSSLAYFLASYQVHEKSILLALVPASFLFASNPLLIGWFQILGTFTMYPLLKRDELSIPYVACCAMYVCLILSTNFNVFDAFLNDGHEGVDGNADVANQQVSSTKACSSKKQQKQQQQQHINEDSLDFCDQSRLLHKQNQLKVPFLSFLVFLSCTGMLVLHVMELTMPPPTKLPDLYPALFAIFGAGNFLVMYIIGVAAQCGWMYSTQNNQVISSDSSSSDSGSNSKKKR